MGPRLLALLLVSGCQIALDVKEVPLDKCDDHTPPIRFVQIGGDNPNLPQATVDVTMPQPETGCDLNVVHIAWGTTFSGIASVTDDLGNSYERATQDSYAAVYFAAAIVGGPNTIHVAFNAPSDSFDVRVIEYEGVGGLDASTSATGAGMTMAAGPVTTTHGYDLLVAGDSVSGQTVTPFAPAWTQRAFTMPNGNVAVDRVVTTAGDNAIAGLQEDGSTGAWWTLNLVAFKGVLAAPP
jgi:hypothetical protein